MRKLERLKFIPLARDKKTPAREGDWHNHITDDEAVWQVWLSQGLNIGLPLEENDLSVIDCDGVKNSDGTYRKTGKDVAREIYRKHKELFTNVNETRRGFHIIFSGPTKTRQLIWEGEVAGDVKGNGYILWYPSELSDGNFRFVYRSILNGPLLPFPEELFPIAETTRDGVQTVLRPPIDENDPVRRLIRAREWMKKREGKEDGHGRGLQMIKTCRALFGMFGLTEAQVWPLILEFNERCVPPYTEKQLRHKVADSQKGT